MIRLSSDWTLFYKFFLPTVWIVFFGITTGVLLFTLRPALPFVLGAVLCYSACVAFLYFTILQLKRVEGTAEHMYVTNYFKTYRYTLDSIAKITSSDFLIFKVVTLHFAESTSFGRRIHFIRRRTVWEEYLYQHDELMRMYQKNV